MASRYRGYDDTIKKKDRHANVVIFFVTKNNTTEF